MVGSRDCGSMPQWVVDSGGSMMRGVVAMAILGTGVVGLGGCSSFSFDYFKSTPPTVQVQLESNPPGADGRTSLGPGCKTPCSVSVPAPETGFSVSYTLAKFQSATVQVQVIHNPGDLATPATTVTDPNPAFPELQPARPPPKPTPPTHPKAAKAPVPVPPES